MDTKRLAAAHTEMSQCLKGECGHKSLSKCISAINLAHKEMGDEIAGVQEEKREKEKAATTEKQFRELSKNDPDIVRKAAAVVNSARPVLID